MVFVSLLALPRLARLLSEYKVSRCSRRCNKLQRPLKSGEVFYSVVLESDDDFSRVDISAEAWEGPPEKAVGWWKGKMPETNTGKMKLAPNHVLVDLVKQMSEEPQRESVRYLLALLLMRKRVLKAVESVEDPEAGKLTLEVASDGSQIELVECSIPNSEREKIRDELTELLYCEVEE